MRAPTNRIRFWQKTFWLAGVFWLMGSVTAFGATIKVAMVTPEGSAWTNAMHAASEQIREQTSGKLAFTIYAGGVSGDEVDVLRKMRARRLDAAGFSGVGLGKILPRIRVLEAPLLFGSHKQLDRVKTALFEELAADFLAKGYVLLGFAEAGFVYLFAKKDISSDPAFQKAKMWTWKGDPVAEKFLRHCGLRTFPLHLADVHTGLETGMIDAFYSPPLAAVAFQWYGRIDHMLDFPVVNSTGAMLMRKEAFARLSADQQKILKTVVGDACRQLVARTRKDNAEAIEVIKEQGVKVLSPDNALVTRLRSAAEKTRRESIPAIYDQATLSRVQKLLEARP